MMIIDAAGLWPRSDCPDGTKRVEAPDETQVEVARKWIQEHCSASATYGKRSSYGLKHEVEQWTHHASYVSNGAFIEAARREGYEYKPTDRGSLNALFRMRVRKAEH